MSISEIVLTRKLDREMERSDELARQISQQYPHRAIGRPSDICPEAVQSRRHMCGFRIDLTATAQECDTGPNPRSMLPPADDSSSVTLEVCYEDLVSDSILPDTVADFWRKTEQR